MGRRAALVALVLVIVLVIAGTVALSNGRDTLEHQRTVAEAAWKPLRAPLTIRYQKLAELAFSANSVAARPVFTQAGAAQARWTDLQKRAFQPEQVPREVTAANNLEGLVGRVVATIPDSPKLNGNPQVQAALTALNGTVPPPALVGAYDNAVSKYSHTRTSFWDRVPAEMFGYHPLPSFAMVATG